MTEYVEKYISASDGLKLYIRDYRADVSSKKTIFCLSGLTRNSQDFDQIASVLNKQGHRVVTMDYRGRGQSEFDANWENYTPQTYVSDIFQVASALGLHACIFIGTSLGGLMSMAMCAIAPGLVHSVVLNDVGPDLDETGLEKIIAYTSDGESVASLDEAVMKLKRHYKDEHGFVDKDWHRIAQNTYKPIQGKYVPSWDTKIAQNLKLARAKQERQDLWPYFKALKERPVLLIRGAQSSVFTRETYEKMLGLLKNIQGIEIPYVGHAPTLEEEPAENTILAFVARH